MSKDVKGPRVHVSYLLTCHYLAGTRIAIAVLQMSTSMNFPIVLAVCSHAHIGLPDLINYL